jgi:hypothetical protein
MASIYLNHELEDDSRRRLIFGGELLLYTRQNATAVLADHAISMISKAFEPYEPERAQFSLSVEEFIRRVGPLKTAFTNDPHTKELVRQVLETFECDLENTYFDVPRLRIVPHGDYLSSGVSYAYKAHRDIWYSSPTAQINWWMPVFTVTAERAMSFFPEYWSKPVKNSSADFDYDEWCTVGRRLATSQVKEDSRKHPLPLEPVSINSELRVAGTKGDVILFSASQLHATAPNSSGATRFSIDFRSINLKDIETGLGAPNIDTRSTGTTIGDFIRASDFAPMKVAGRSKTNAA